MKTLLILTKVENTGLRVTTRFERRDGNWFPVVEAAPEAQALVWSSDSSDFERGVAYAKREGYRTVMMEDTPDVLSRARAHALVSASQD